jgi:hypothetical protein
LATAVGPNRADALRDDEGRGAAVLSQPQIGDGPSLRGLDEAEIGLVGDVPADRLGIAVVAI